MCKIPTFTFNPEPQRIPAPAVLSATSCLGNFNAPSSSKSFPTKLHAMLEDAEAKGFQDIVSWQPGGRSFKVLQPAKFSSDVLGGYFTKQTKYKSFQRQLNIYGFQRIHYGANKGGYSHQYFTRGNPELCHMIVRQSVPLRTSTQRKAQQQEVTTDTIFENEETMNPVMCNTLDTRMDTKKSEQLVGSSPAVDQPTFVGTPFPIEVMSCDKTEEKVEILNPDFFNFSNANDTILLDGLQDQTFLAAPTDNKKTDKNFDEMLSLFGEDSTLLDNLLPTQVSSSSITDDMPPAGSDHIFPWKLHKMLDDAEKNHFDDIISWVEDGAAFKVHQCDKFVEEIMPNYFDQTKYESFRRQLNLYGFARATRGPNRGIYFHQFLLQSDRSLCRIITRPHENRKSRH